MLDQFWLKSPAPEPSFRRHLLQGKLFLFSMLVGLLALAGLIYRAGTAPVQAAGRQMARPARPAPLAPSNLPQPQGRQASAPALSLQTQRTPDPAIAGNILTYMLAIQNLSGFDLSGVILTDTLDSNESFASADNGGLYNAGVVTWNIGALPVSQTITRTLVVTAGNVVSGTILSNTVSTTSNEGFSASATITTTVSTCCVGPGHEIWPISGYTVYQNENLTVLLENHLSQGGPYDIYLGSYKICAGVNTSTQGNGVYVCPIDTSIPPGLYDLFSTYENQYPNRLATAPQPVEVHTLASPLIGVNNGAGGNIAAVNSYITITLVAHQIPDQPFNIYLVYEANSRLITSSVTAAPGPITWRIPNDLGNPCPVGGTPCAIESRRVSSPATVYASTDLYINQPQIVLAGGMTTYTPGETVYISLLGHTPGLTYDLKFSDGLSNTIWLGRTGVTDVNGNTTAPITWTIPLTWPNGIYTITSHPAVGETPRDPASMTSANQIASLNVQIYTLPVSYITIDGGYTWPVGSVITIKVHNHSQANNPYYLKFGPWRVPVSGATPPDTFNVGPFGSYAVNYQIPPTTTLTGITQTFTISSFVNSSNTLVATRNVTISNPAPAPSGPIYLPIILKQ